MKRGARLVLVNFCRDEAGRYLGNTGGVNMFDTFNQIWRDFVAAGRITEAEYKNMTLPQYYNTVEEFSRPLTDESRRMLSRRIKIRVDRNAHRPLSFRRRIPTP